MKAKAMNQEQRQQCEAVGEKDAELWMRHYAPYRYVRMLSDGEGLYELKKKLDQGDGWGYLIRFAYPEVWQQSTVLSDPNITRQQRHAWSVGFERKAIEIAKRRMGGKDGNAT